MLPHGADRDFLLGIAVGQALRRLEALGEPGIGLGGCLRDRDASIPSSVFSMPRAERDGVNPGGGVSVTDVPRIGEAFLLAGRGREERKRGSGRAIAAVARADAS